jgi:hypothetical protein
MGVARGRRNSLLRPVLMAATLVLALEVPALSGPDPVAAHCPGGAQRYAWAQATKVVTNKGTWGSLAWANPAVCALGNGTGFTAEWVTACDDNCTPGISGWAQVGWVKRVGWSQPKGYCELAASPGGTGFGPPPALVEFTLAGVTQPYEVAEAGGTWWCFVNSVTRLSRSTSWMGFATADRVRSGGETMSFHSTIGVMSPSKFLLNDLRSLTNGTWQLINFDNPGPIEFPYGLDEPALGQLRNWTVPH